MLSATGKGTKREMHAANARVIGDSSAPHRRAAIVRARGELSPT
jgi:hypothetical protein